MEERGVQIKYIRMSPITIFTGLRDQNKIFIPYQWRTKIMRQVGGTHTHITPSDVLFFNNLGRYAIAL